MIWFSNGIFFIELQKARYNLVNVFKRRRTQKITYKVYNLKKKSQKVGASIYMIYHNIYEGWSRLPLVRVARRDSRIFPSRPVGLHKN